MGGRRSEAAVPKGYVPMLVGKEMGREERFLVHTKLFRHPAFVGLLDMAEEEFGYEQRGILRIPCDAERFRAVIRATLSIGGKS